MYRIRHALRSAHEQGEEILSPQELMLIAEIGYEIEKNGSIKEKDGFMRFASGFRFTFKTCCRVLNCVGYDQSAFAHNGWNCMQRTIKVRDRLMHPKDPKDLMVTRSELAAAKEAEQWFMSLASEILALMRAKYDV